MAQYTTSICKTTGKQVTTCTGADPETPEPAPARTSPSGATGAPKATKAPRKTQSKK